jgi:cytochrome c oxidase subunit 2
VVLRRTRAITLAGIGVLSSSLVWQAAASSGARPAGLHAQAQPAEKVTVEVTAERFSFTPSEIRGKVGVPIEFTLRSDDTDHGFRILDTDIDVRIPKRGKGVAKVTFTPARAGKYTIECSHVCGAGHSFMRATIVIK